MNRKIKEIDKFKLLKISLELDISDIEKIEKILETRNKSNETKLKIFREQIQIYTSNKQKEQIKKWQLAEHTIETILVRTEEIKETLKEDKKYIIAMLEGYKGRIKEIENQS